MTVHRTLEMLSGLDLAAEGGWLFILLVIFNRNLIKRTSQFTVSKYTALQIDAGQFNKLRNSVSLFEKISTCSQALNCTNQTKTGDFITLERGQRSQRDLHRFQLYSLL